MRSGQNPTRIRVQCNDFVGNVGTIIIDKYVWPNVTIDKYMWGFVSMIADKLPYMHYVKPATIYNHNV